MYKFILTGKNRKAKFISGAGTFFITKKNNLHIYKIHL